MSAELEAVIGATQDRFNWHLRLHPNQIEGFATHESARFWRFYEERLTGLAQWKPATQNPLPLALSQMDLHVTWSSSVCIEAAHFGLRTCLLDPRNRPGGARGDFYAYYRRTGAVDLVENSIPSIQEWLYRNAGNPRLAEDYATYDRAFDAVIEFLAR